MLKRRRSRRRGQADPQVVPARRPVVAGAAGGVGTSMVAELLDGIDDGVLAEGNGCDVLVARATSDGLVAAQAALGRLSPLAGKPLLVLVGDAPRYRPFDARVRARLARGWTCGILAVPWVEFLRHHSDPRGALAAARSSGKRPLRWARPLLGLSVAAREVLAERLAEDLAPDDPSDTGASGQDGPASPDGSPASPTGDGTPMAAALAGPATAEPSH
ncbi:hypothetical protein [Lolliginicoccus levis]|uniref:hypothetical protein n=1 Tax=Lolliginicoccus levis TaxID=2919542 RepID=UPI002420233D|nr:hypothetical protein [Lolliginicoccus levis]